MAIIAQEFFAFSGGEVVHVSGFPSVRGSTQAIFMVAYWGLSCRAVSGYRL